MPSGRPQKKAKNISGLWNQPQPDSWPSHAPEVTDIAQSQSYRDGMNNELTDNLIFDSLKPNFAEEDARSTGSDWEELSEWEEPVNEHFGESMAVLALKENPNDVNWLPDGMKRKLERRAKEKKGKFCSFQIRWQLLKLLCTVQEPYVKGPDVMLKLERTQHHYCNEWKAQTSLLDHFISNPPSQHDSISYTSSPPLLGNL